MSTDPRVSDDWARVASFLPENLDEIAVECGALRRKREIRSASALVRLCLVYGLEDMSLRETSAWAKEAGVASFSDVAVLKRLRTSVPLLRRLCSLLVPAPQRLASGLRLVIEDATTLCRKRSQGTDFRVHVKYLSSDGAFSGIELTRADGGERLDRLACGAGDVLVADMGYQARKGLFRVRQEGAHVVVRFFPTQFPLESLDGQRLSPFELVDALSVGEVLDLPVRTAGTKDASPILGRMVAVRKPDDKVEEGLRRKKKRSGKSPGDLARRAERYVMLFTTLPLEKAGAREILEIYRIRWQVETAFKRVKGIVSLGRTQAKDLELCECEVLARLLILLLVQACERAFFPWGGPLARSELMAQA